MKTKTNITLMLAALILASCAPAARVIPTEAAVPSSTFTAGQTIAPTPTSSPEVSWQLKEGNLWAATGTPPLCPDPLVFAPPTDLKKVTSILYPRQPRGDAFKPHGGFRFSDQTPNNQVTVTIPFDAEIVQGSRAFRNGENQFSFVLIAPCGIWYSLGHLLELSPKFLAIANSLPLVDDTTGFHTQQFYEVNPPIPVTTGEVIATAVGYAIPHNVFFDFGVLDLRHKNGFTIRPEWAAQFGQQFDEYGICWLDLLPADDAAYLRTLNGGDWEYGQLSDYCQ